MNTRLFIGCTPRTGNLWFRRLLAGALDLQDYAAHAVADIPWKDLLPGCIVSMHAHVTPELRRLLQDGGFRVLVTSRHPLDVLLSILHFSKLEPATAMWLDREGGDETSLAQAGPLDEAFLDYCVSPRASALLGVSVEWLAFAEAIGRYERFVAHPKRELSKTLAKLELKPVRPLQQVIEESNFQNLRSSLGPLQRHFWRGQPGVWRKVLPGDVARPIAAHHRAVFEQFGYACDYDPALDRERALENWEELCRPYSPPAPKRSWFSFLHRG
jgi:hypothetical protein